MPIYRLDEDLWLPRPELADASGLLAVGGDLRPERLLLAYSHGIFPWYERDQPILWHSPDPRFVLELERLHVPRSLRKTLRAGTYEIRLDTEFSTVIRRCGKRKRKGQRGTWITPEMIAAYGQLHELGVAHSAEAWVDDKLVGGLYGVSLGGAFFGESMFADAPDASKVAFVTLCERLGAWGIDLIDSQVRTDHLARFGAEDWPRDKYLERLQRALELPTRRGRWRLGD